MMTSSGEGPFEATGGSVLGRDHLLAGRNNQDAFGWRASGSALAAVVCDGCGSAPSSEVGASLFARLLPELFLRALARGIPPGQELLDEVQAEALSALRTFVEALGGELRERVHDFLLFTVVGAVLHEQGACFFSLGDGLLHVNDEPIALGPFEGNAPPYLAYGVLGGKVRFELHRTLPLEDVERVLLGTDGAATLLEIEDRTLPGRRETVGSLAALVDDRAFRNRDALRRRLALLNREAAFVVDGRLRREPGLLPDDTTLIAIRRRQGA